MVRLRRTTRNSSILNNSTNSTRHSNTNNHHNTNNRNSNSRQLDGRVLKPNIAPTASHLPPSPGPLRPSSDSHSRIWHHLPPNSLLPRPTPRSHQRSGNTTNRPLYNKAHTPASHHPPTPILSMPATHPSSRRHLPISPQGLLTNNRPYKPRRTWHRHLSPYAQQTDTPQTPPHSGLLLATPRTAAALPLPAKPPMAPK